jgi:hypothetical protein
MLHGEFQVVQSTALDALEEAKFLLNIREWLRETELSLFILDGKFGILWGAVLEVRRDELDN